MEIFSKTDYQKQPSVTVRSDSFTTHPSSEQHFRKNSLLSSVAIFPSSSAASHRLLVATNNSGYFVYAIKLFASNGHLSHCVYTLDNNVIKVAQTSLAQILLI